ncbi:hypothetical protein FE392_12245 [Xenorhabdus sp. 12]|uniref:Transposase n=1 Tax=Xenorhabdus santafensis TaxID=2582833 RepID=A0ABU4SBH3_9GAMM|nr:hypothetical protein [Xenorhabdus sp. 12]MDX7988096.1 hypothetical protein [Xenorhabdus sp. 12]
MNETTKSESNLLLPNNFWTTMEIIVDIIFDKITKIINLLIRKGYLSEGFRYPANSLLSAIAGAIKSYLESKITK